MKINKKIKGIDSNLLRRYLETRKAIAKKADRISGIVHLFSLLKHSGEDTVPVCPSALASCADIIDSDVCGIVECLDDFIFLTDAEEAVDKPNN